MLLLTARGQVLKTVTTFILFHSRQKVFQSGWISEIIAVLEIEAKFGNWQYWKSPMSEIIDIAIVIVSILKIVDIRNRWHLKSKIDCSKFLNILEYHAYAFEDISNLRYTKS